MKSQAELEASRRADRPCEVCGRDVQAREVEASGGAACIAERAASGELDPTHAERVAMTLAVGDGDPDRRRRHRHRRERAAALRLEARERRVPRQPRSVGTLADLERGVDHAAPELHRDIGRQVEADERGVDISQDHGGVELQRLQACPRDEH